ncbi:MAG: hypothetical protein Q8M69_00795 [Reyranella sp.]|nr:hypothetical protein [Reyranella sp.]
MVWSHIAGEGRPRPATVTEVRGYAQARSYMGAARASRQSVSPQGTAAAREAVHHRIRAYEDLARKEAVALRNWEATSFPPLVRLLDERGWLKVLTWESCIDAIADNDKQAGAEIRSFYERCLSFSSIERMDRAAE